MGDRLAGPNRRRMVFEVVDGEGSPVVKVIGELDANTVPGLEAALDPIVSVRPPRLTIDASGLVFVDSSGIALWVRWSNLVGRVEIRDAPPQIRASIARLGLAHRLLVVPDVATSASPTVAGGGTA